MPGKRNILAVAAILVVAWFGAQAQAVDYQGGSNRGEHGFVQTDWEYVNNDTLTATGGTYDNPDLNAPADSSTGMFIPNGSFTNHGTATGTGGSGVRSYGIFVSNDFTNHGTVTGAGGNGYYSSGIFASNDFTNHGTATGTGGSGVYSYGIYASNGFTNHGTATGTGGSGSGSYGIYTDNDFINQGTATGTGGSGNEAHGIRVANDFTNHGTATGTGGSGPNTRGIHIVNNFTNHGTAFGFGDSARYSHGIYTANDFTNLGTATGTGGSGEMSIGIIFNDFTNHGTVNGTGGSGDYSYGMYASNDFTNHGIATFSGGDGDTAYGFMTEEKFTNNGLLILAPGGASASVGFTYDSPNTSLSFAANSTLMLAGGRIEMRDGSIGAGGITSLSIDPTAKVVILDSASVGMGDTLDKNGFITHIKAPDTVFENYNTATLSYVFTRNGSDMNAAVTRTASASSFASGNGQSLLSWLEDTAREMTMDERFDNFSLTMLGTYADHLPDSASIGAYANQLAKEYTPQATANLLPSLATVSRLTAHTLSSALASANSITNMASAQSAVSAASGNAYANFSPDAVRSAYFWASPLYYHGSLNGETGYSDQKENAVGGSIGAALRRDRLTLGLAGHYVYSDINGGYSYDADYNGYGFNLGGSYRFGNGQFSPLLSLTGGWTRYDLDQTRRTTLDSVILPGSANSVYQSSPDIDVFSGSVMLSNTFDFCRSSLTPELGFDYAYTRLKSYTESGGNLAMHVESENYKSAQAVLGLTYAFRVTDKLTLSMKGQYRHEFADKRSALRARSTSYPSFNYLSVESQNYGRSSGILGAGISYRATNRASLSLNYDLHLSRKYHGHQVSAALGISF